MSVTDSLGASGRGVQAALGSWDGAASTARLWERDASLWTGSDEGRWLGWLATLDGVTGLDPVVAAALVAQVEREGLRHVRGCPPSSRTASRQGF